MNVSHLATQLATFAFVFLVAVPCGCDSDSANGRLRLLALDGRELDPLATVASAKATVFLFARTDCPISNRLAPEVHRLFDAFSPRGVEFYLVYPDPAQTPDEIRQHIKDYSYRPTALRDVHHDLVKRTAARVTPEASVFASDGTLTYHGRINDRYVDYGMTRAAATRHDLEDAIEATLQGRPLAETRSRGVGCPIPRL